jgi:hypothetical protein
LVVLVVTLPVAAVALGRSEASVLQLSAALEAQDWQRLLPERRQAAHMLQEVTHLVVAVAVLVPLHQGLVGRVAVALAR